MHQTVKMVSAFLVLLRYHEPFKVTFNHPMRKVMYALHTRIIIHTVRKVRRYGQSNEPVKDVIPCQIIDSGPSTLHIVQLLPFNAIPRFLLFFLFIPPLLDFFRVKILFHAVNIRFHTEIIVHEQNPRYLNEVTVE